MRKITLFAMLLVGILAGRAQSALVGTYDGNINPVHMNGAGEELTGKTVVISETDKGEINVTLPSFVLMTGMSTKEVTIENITVTNNEDGTCTLSSDSVAITPVNPMNPDMVMVPYKSTLTGVVGNGAIELAVAVPVQPGVIMTTATFKGAKKFELVSVDPNATTPTTSVNVIRLIFSKEVTVTLPEGGIEVVNNDTKEVIKIASVLENPYLEKTNVVFEFEKKVVIDKDGKEEEQAQYISAPGTYSFTVPAGCIKSVDGDEFADSTFTFSVVGTFEIENFTPAQTTSLDKIELTFDKEVINVAFPTGGIIVFDNDWNIATTITKHSVSEDNKTVTLELDEPITTPGTYSLNIDPNLITTAAGKNQYKALTINVIDPTPRFETNYKNGDKVKVGELKNFEISFENVETVELKNTEFTVLSLSAQSAITGTAAYSEETGKITVTLSQELTQDGDYVFQIPAGMFTMDGVENEKRDVQINIFTFTIVPLEVVSVTPVAGEVGSISEIVVKFNQYVKLYYKDGVTLSQDIYLTCGDEKFKLTNTGSAFISDELVYSSATWDGYDYVSNPITTPGTYTLNLEDIIVFYGADDIIEEEWYSYAETWHEENASCKGIYTWTIGDSDEAAAKFVNAETAEQVIYDLLGRRVEKVTTAGIYIVNGRKVIIK